MRTYTILYIAILFFLLTGCEGKFEPTNSLDSVNLLLPINNEQCLGIKLDTDKVRVEFHWDDINQVANYIIDYADGVTRESNSLTTSDSFIFIDLEPGTLYTWNVTVSDDFGDSKKSEDFSFYTEGLAEANHVPFPAKIEIQENPNNNVDVLWEGGDLDDDIDYYQVFFSQENPPIEFIDNTTENSFNIDVVSGSIYYLNIITFDQNGNFSESKLSRQF